MVAEDQLQKQRLPTGIPGLDTLLRGGFLRGGLYILMGAPGAGKTILGNQICFNHVASGGSATYITLLAETHTKMMAHLERLAFFRIDPIADTLRYISGYRILEDEGLDGFLAFLRRTMTQQSPSLLVIDGMATLEAMEQSNLVIKRFFHELQAYTEVSKCTIVLLTHAPYTQQGRPEHTMVDGLIELRDRTSGLRAVRELEIRKFRGTGYLRGTHYFTITDSGITVYPRVEALLATPAESSKRDFQKLQFGNEVLDQLLGGGLNEESTALIFGPSGSGKTILGLHFLAAGAQVGECGLLFGFYERPTWLVRQALGIGLAYDQYIDDQQITIMWHSATENVLDVLAQELLNAVHQHNVKRVFIDGLDALKETMLHPERLTRFLAALMNELRGLGTTTLISAETYNLMGPAAREPLEGISAIVDSILYLRTLEIDSQLHRLIAILKMRGNAYDTSIHEFSITAEGIRVSASPESAKRLLKVSSDREEQGEPQ